MFCLGRADGGAAGDLALQVGVARAFGYDERPSAQETPRAVRGFASVRDRVG